MQYVSPLEARAPEAAGRRRSPPSPSPEHNARIFEANLLPLLLYDPEERSVLDANPVACAMYGYTREEFVGRSLADIEEPAADPDSGQGVRVHRLKSGQLIYVDVTELDVAYCQRAARCMCSRDVTPLARTMTDLHRSEVALRHAQAVAALAYVITRPDGTLESWSETLPGIAMVGADDVPKTIGDWIRRIVHPDDRSGLRAAVLSAKATGAPTELKYRIQRADGAVRYIRHVVEPPESHPGTPSRARCFSTLQDVTLQTLSELRVLQLNEELERRVLERTAAAERANRAKSEFLSHLSHELRTPLNAILGFGQLLADFSPEMVPEHKRTLYAQQIVKAGRHVLTLVNETLDLACIEAGKLTLRIEGVDLSEVLNDCATMIEPLAARRGIHLAFSTDCHARVAADRTRLKQILLNLLSNAVKYDREGGTVSLACETRGDFVRLAVRDTGPGMNAEDLDALFQPFSRPGQEGRNSEGTGMGLVISRRLLEAMGGRIGVQSALGEGTTFWIETRSSPLEGAPDAPLMRVDATANASEGRRG